MKNTRVEGGFIGGRVHLCCKSGHSGLIWRGRVQILSFSLMLSPALPVAEQGRSLDCNFGTQECLASSIRGRFHPRHRGS